MKWIFLLSVVFASCNGGSNFDAFRDKQDSLNAAPVQEHENGRKILAEVLLNIEKESAFPANDAIPEFRRLRRVDSSFYIRLTERDIQLIPTHYLNKVLPAYDFYSLHFHAADYEYSLGSVPAIAAYRPGEIKLLLPTDYTGSSLSFIRLLDGKEIKENKEILCEEIASLWFRSLKAPNSCCAPEIEDPKHESNWVSDTLILNSTYTLLCEEDTVKANCRRLETLKKQQTKFIFRDDCLVRMFMTDAI